MTNRTRLFKLDKRASLALLFVSVQGLACGSQDAATDTTVSANQDSSAGAPSSGAAATESKTGGAAQTTTMAGAATAGESANARARAANSGTSGTGSSATSANAPAVSTQSAGSAAPAGGEAGSGAATGDVTPAEGGTAGAAGAMATAGTMSDAAGSAGEPAAEQEDYGKGDGSDVVTIGDSWMSIATNGGGIEGALDRAGTSYRHYAVAGTQLLNGQIPSQYDQAKRLNPDIKTIIMTGGGNDVMFSGGCNTKEACTAFSQMIADGLDELWTKAEADGATAAVYIQYSRNAGTAPSDTRPDMPAVPTICTGGTFRCVFISTTDLIDRTDTVDGIHPTLDGCDRIAERVMEEMEKAGVRR